MENGKEIQTRRVQKCKIHIMDISVIDQVLGQDIWVINKVWGQEVWVIDQVWDHDGWILAKFFFFVCLWTETESRSINSQKKIEANIYSGTPL